MQATTIGVQTVTDDDDDFMAHLSKGLGTIVDNHVPEPPPKPSIFAKMNWEAEFKKAMDKPMSDDMLEAFKSLPPSYHKATGHTENTFREMMMGTFEPSPVNVSGLSIQEQYDLNKIQRYAEMYGGTVSGRYSGKSNYEYLRHQHGHAMVGKRSAHVIMDEFGDLINMADAVQKEKDALMKGMVKSVENSNKVYGRIPDTYIVDDLNMGRDEAKAIENFKKGIASMPNVKEKKSSFQDYVYELLTGKKKS